VLNSREFLERHRSSPGAFSRQRQLNFVVMILLMVNMIKRALQDELDEFFRLLSEAPVAERVVTKSAFSQARQKLQHTAFIELNQVQVAYFSAHFTPERWHGLRLLALDGSMCSVPATPALAAHFGVWQAHAGGACPKARLSQLFDVCNHVTIDAQLAPKAVGERALAARHWACLGPDDLVLLDRGYPAFWLFAGLRQQQAHFCARLSVSEWTVAKRFVASGAAEQALTLHPTAAMRRACRAHHVPCTPLPLRLVRVRLATGEVEVLATSLGEAARWPCAWFADLYHQRWPVETDYRTMKSRLELENWTGLSVEAVYQDFHANVFTKNLAALLAQPAQPVVAAQYASRTHPYQINFANLLSKCKDTVVTLLTHTHCLPWLTALWQQMLTTVELIRPNRAVPRQPRVKPKRFPMAYKPLR
jgi:DDE family transposase